MVARAYPDALPEWVRANPLRDAEVRIYDLLRAQLSSKYSVFYSRPWVGTNPDGTEKEGEADFVVASQETGFLVIEVKGGGVGRDGRDGVWFSIDRDGRRHTIKDPVRQALRSKNELLHRLRQRPEMAGKWIGTGSAVILPHCTGASGLQGIDTPADHFAFAEDLNRLGDWVRERLAHTLGDRGGALGSYGITALEHLIASSFKLRVPQASTIDADHYRDITVTEQQYALLDFLAEHCRAAIGGAAGSGKTMLAIHKAIELANAVNPAPVLLTCFNAPLGQSLARAASRVPNLYAGSFHEACSQVAREAGVPIPKVPTIGELYEKGLSDALLEAVSKRPELAFHGVIVDEGQDFLDRWLDALQLSLHNEKSAYWVFYDDNQSLYGRPNTLLRTMPQSPFVLRKNVRNPRTVFEKLRPYLGNQTVIPLGPQGRPVEEIVVPNPAALSKRLSRTITRLVESDQVDPSDIAVLFARKRDILDTCPERRFGRVSTCDANASDTGKVCVDTVRRFKGLERKVIVLVEPRALLGEGDLLYVALSRATAHMITIGTEALPKLAEARD